MERGDSSRATRDCAFALTTGTLATVVFFYRAVFSSEIFVARDILRVYYPLRSYWAERVLRGEFPHWYPYDGLGQPFVGMVISGALHPSNLLYLVLPVESALKLNVLLCYPLAFAGAFLFARRWGAARSAAALAGTVFAFNGYMVSITNNLLYLEAAATFPWALWAADRLFAVPTARRLALAALLLVLVLLAGDSQMFAVTASLVLVVAAVRGRAQPRKTAGYAAATIALAALLGGAQIVPGAAVMREARAGFNSLDIALIWSLHPLRLLEFALGPLFLIVDGLTSGEIASALLKTGTTGLWVDSTYIGAHTLLLAGIGFLAYRRRVGAWVMVALTTLVLALALGKHLGLYALVFKLVPLWRPFRFPEKLLPALFFLLSLGAAAGLQSSVDAPRHRRRALLATIAAATSLGLLFVVERRWTPYSQHMLAWLWAGPLPQQQAEQLGQAFATAVARSALLLVGLVASIAFIRPSRLGWATAVLALLSFFVAEEQRYQISPPDLLHVDNGFAQIIGRREGPPQLGNSRICALVEQPSTLPSADGLNTADAFAAAIASSMQAVTPALLGLEGSNNYLPASTHQLDRLTHGGTEWLGRLSGLFGTRYLVLDAQSFESIGGNHAAVIDANPAFRLVLLENPTALPRAYLARRRCAPSVEEGRKTILSKDFTPGEEAVMECDKADAPGDSSPGPLGTVAIASYEPERVEVRVRASREATLVLNDAYYSGWSAQIDGHPAEILRTNLVVRGVEVPAGEHTVVFLYRPRGWIVGASLTGLGLLVAIGCCLRRQRRISSLADENRQPDGASENPTEPQAAESS